MNWEAIGAIGEVLGALAVVITLMYLALQLKENAKGLRVQSLNETFRERSEMMRELQDMSSIGGIMAKAVGEDEMTDHERSAARIYLNRVCAVSDKLHYLHSIGAADDFNFASFRPQLKFFVGTSFFSEWWAESGGQFSSGFRTYVETISQEIQA